MAEKDLTFTEHLAELRRRIILSFTAVLLGAVVSWIFRGPLVEALLAPAGGRSFIFLAPPDLFLAYLRMALTAGTALAAPFVAYQAAAFLLPALRGREKILLLLLLPLGAVFFAAGVLFAYFAVLPLALRFFLSFTAPGVTAALSFPAYVDFCLSFTAAFGAAFELPVLVVLLTKTGIVRRETLSRARGYALLLILILAAVLTPPDVASQIMLAAPLYLLFEASILLARLFGN